MHTRWHSNTSRYQSLDDLYIEKDTVAVRLILVQLKETLADKRYSGIGNLYLSWQHG
jgi:hypothetical protein